MSEFHHSRQKPKELAHFISGEQEINWDQDFRRIADTTSHPLFTFDQLLPTEPITELFTKLKRAIILRKTSVCLGAPSGTGKSSALDVLRAMITRAYPDMPTFLHDTNNHEVPSIRGFFKGFLVAVGSERLTGETFDLKNRLFNTLIDVARVKSQNTVLLLIDEAQVMKVSDFDFLKDVYNALARAGIQQISVLMGEEPGLSNLLRRLENTARLDLMNRFAVSPDQFRTYRTKADIEKIFDAIDHAEYPRGSGVTWTMAFFPHMWRKGFRLVHQSNNFVSELKQTGTVGEREEPIFDMPARQAFLAIRSFIAENASFDVARDIPKEAWKRALTEAGLMD